MKDAITWDDKEEQITLACSVSKHILCDSTHTNPVMLQDTESTAQLLYTVQTTN